MKDIIMFYLENCGYCDKAHKAIDELIKENKDYEKINITKVEESLNMEYANTFDYYATPTFYVDNKKIFEAHIGMSYEDIKNEVKNVLDKACSKE